MLYSPMRAKFSKDCYSTSEPSQPSVKTKETCIYCASFLGGPLIALFLALLIRGSAHLASVWIHVSSGHVCVLFCFVFFFFFSRVFGRVRLLFNEQQPQMLTFFSEQCIRALFTDPQISFFINFFIKNGSHGTIYTFKNYFATVISVISFQFQ